MIVVLIGAPGAGKGTQADILASNDRFLKISTGDALRKHVKAGTEIGKQAGEIMARGELVPDDILLKILKAELDAVPKDSTIILDGYPRNISQAETLDKTAPANHPIKVCLHLDVERKEIVARLAGRRVCPGCGASYHVENAPPKVNGVCDKCSTRLTQRPDDEPKSIAVRLDVYERNTKPVLDFYRAKGVYVRVAGTGATADIQSEMRLALEDMASR